MGFKEKSWGPLSSAAALALSVTLIWTGFMQFVPETGIRIGLNPPARRCLHSDSILSHECLPFATFVWNPIPFMAFPWSCTFTCKNAARRAEKFLRSIHGIHLISGPIHGIHIHGIPENWKDTMPEECAILCAESVESCYSVAYQTKHQGYPPCSF